jgi:hypothetical protein
VEQLIWTGSNQRIPEYHAWVAVCLGLGCRRYVELGCGSSHEQASAGIECVTVDLLPNGLHNVPHIEGNTHDPATLQRVLAHFGGNAPDIVFIDADHSREGVTADFNLWYPVARLAVGFHDILIPGVKEFWEDAALLYPSVQIVARDIESAERWQHLGHVRGQVNCGGIGVIFK